MKKHLLWLCLAVMLTAASCANATPPEIELDYIDLDDISIMDRSDPVIEQLAEGEIFTIVWDSFSPQPNQMMKRPDDGKIAQALNERFGVAMSSSLWTDWDWMEVQKKQIESGTLPDIFMPYDTLEDIINSGAVRPIPMSMIERFAPRYAEALRGMGDMLTFYQEMGGGENFFLHGLEKPLDALITYSVYRLDWLEELGIMPHGRVIELSDRLYFTDQAFTMDELVNIMVRFSESENTADNTRFMMNTKRYGISVGSPWWMEGVDSLLGMWGLNGEIIQGLDGNAEMAYASDGFRMFMEFMERLRDMEVLHATEQPWNDRYNNGVGWWCDDIRNIFGDWGYHQNFMRNNTDMKILLTPPEIGPTGMQGARSNLAWGSEMRLSVGFMISSNVSDAKLAKILEIFDAISFDPEVYVLTKYGIEGEDFTWQGEPYNSPVDINRDSDEYTNLFVTRTIDGNAGKHVYEFPNMQMYQYATGNAARAITRLPFKADPDNTLTDELREIAQRHEAPAGSTLQVEYFNDIIFGRKNVATSWDEYMAAWLASGLDEILEVINRYPVTNHP
jgi:hypothetical protein